MSRLRRVERTEGRRKGYSPHKSSIASRMSGKTLRELNVMRASERHPERKPADARGERDNGPARKV